METGAFEVTDWASAVSAIDPGVKQNERLGNDFLFCFDMVCLNDIYSSSEEPKYVMLISGLSFGETIPAGTSNQIPIGGQAFSTGERR